MSNDDNQYPQQHTKAAQMLARAFATRTDLTQRDVAKVLGYKASVVISHMASGRAAIPLERAVEIAEVLSLDVGEFVLAVLEQRFPSLIQYVTDAPTQAFSSKETDLIRDLQVIAGGDLSSISQDRLDIIREVLSDREPSRRWLTLAELPAVQALRLAIPRLRDLGASASIIKRLRSLTGGAK